MEFIVWVTPILLSVIAYLGHRAISDVDEDIKDLKKGQYRLDKSVEKANFNLEAHATVTKSALEKIEYQQNIMRSQVNEKLENNNFELSEMKKEHKEMKTHYGQIIQVLKSVPIRESKIPQKK